MSNVRVRFIFILVMSVTSAVRGRVVCVDGVCFNSRLKIALVENRGLTYCQACLDPLEQGSHVDVWEAHFHPSDYRVSGELVYAVPNDVSADILNEDSVRGNIVLIDRGKVPLVTKVRRAQEAGAVGVVIVDDGSCNQNFECGGNLGSRSHGYFCAQDHAVLWKNIVIPTVLTLQTHGNRMKEIMDLETMNLPDHGIQYMEKFE